MSTTNLATSDKQLFRLVNKGRQIDGWTSVSKMLWPIVSEIAAKFPDLVETKPAEEGGFIKLTAEGETVVKWL